MSITVQIDIPADNLEKANDFYLKLFGRKIEKITDNAEDPGGNIENISCSKEIAVYIGVHSIDEYIEKIESLGGQALTQKMVVQGWGYLAICMDNASNIFNIWEKNIIPNSQPEWLPSSP